MKAKWLKLAAELLQIASDKFSNHGCNDFELPSEWTEAECDEFVLAMHTLNGDPEFYEPGDNRFTQDWFAMWFLGRILLKESEDKS